MVYVVSCVYPQDDQVAQGQIVQQLSPRRIRLDPQGSPAAHHLLAGQPRPRPCGTVAGSGPPPRRQLAGADLSSGCRLPSRGSGREGPSGAWSPQEASGGLPHAAGRYRAGHRGGGPRGGLGSCRPPDVGAVGTARDFGEGGTFRPCVPAHRSHDAEPSDLPAFRTRHAGLDRAHGPGRYFGNGLFHPPRRSLVPQLGPALSEPGGHRRGTGGTGEDPVQPGRYLVPVRSDLDLFRGRSLGQPAHSLSPGTPHQVARSPDLSSVISGSPWW